MKLTIVAATGGVGGHVLRQALHAGHTVTAVVRRPASLSIAVPAATVDLANPDVDALDDAVGQADAVISALGPRGRGEIGIVAPGTKEIVAAMQRTGTRRLVAVSGAGVSTVPTPDRPNPPRREPGAGWVNRYVNTPLARRVLGERAAAHRGVGSGPLRPRLAGPVRRRIAVQRERRRAGSLSARSSKDYWNVSSRPLLPEMPMLFAVPSGRKKPVKL